MNNARPDYTDLPAMNALSDEALWEIARSPQRMVFSRTEPRNPSLLSSISASFRQMARKQEAVRLLKARGYEIKLRDLKAK